MKKDARKRNCIKEYGIYKLRYNALRKNDIIPLEIQVTEIISMIDAIKLFHHINCVGSC